MTSYKDGKLVLTESSIRSLDEILDFVDKEKLYSTLLIDFLELRGYISEIVDNLNSGN